MGMEIVKSPNGAPEWESKIELIKKTVAKGATNDELDLFLYQARKSGLDPLAKQIHCVRRWNNKTNSYDMAIQTGIDGYRLIADRTGLYAGNDDPEFDDPEKEPKWAKVTIYKMVQGQRCPFTATARWSQYYPGDKQGFMWKKMPHLMLGKCAEALALRKAFPAELSGIYTHEEMDQASREEKAVEVQSVNGDEAVAKNTLRCEGSGCGRAILPYTHPTEGAKTLVQVLDEGRKRFKLDLCGGCQIKLGKSAPVEELNPAFEIHELEAGECAIRGIVTEIFIKHPLTINCGGKQLVWWHKNKLMAELKESRGKLIDCICAESDGKYSITKVHAIGNQRFVNNQPVTELEASTAV